MDKSNFKKIALMGMAGGMLIASQSPVVASISTEEMGTVIAGSGCANGCRAKSSYSGGGSCGNQSNPRGHSCGNQSNPKGHSCGGNSFRNNTAYEDSTTTQSTRRMMTESDLSSLTPEFQKLSPEGKALALKLANQDCKGKNDCKGLNSCKTANNSCAGQGGCKGTTPGPFTDKVKAVKVAAQKMAEKRTSMNYNSNY